MSDDTQGRRRARLVRGRPRARRSRGSAAWTTAHIVDYLGKGYSARAGSFGPMNAVIANSTRRLTQEDLRAIAVYLKSLRGADYAGEAVSAEAAQAGRPLYEKHCRECHGPSGRGGPFEGPPLAGSAIVQGEDASSLINLILHGSDRPDSIGSPSWETMPAYAEALDDAEIRRARQLPARELGQSRAARRAGDRRAPAPRRGLGRAG